MALRARVARSQDGEALGLRAPERKAAAVEARTEAPVDLPPLRWWRELLAIAGFYAVYSFTRSIQGKDSTVKNFHELAEARRRAGSVIELERALHIFHERTIQSWFLGWHLFLQLCNLYYGLVHFAATLIVLLWLFLRHPEHYRRWRWVLAFSTALALIGFFAYPLAPPRLLPEALDQCRRAFVDTIDCFGSLWTFESGPVAKVSNQFAAMPSLHFAWSSWCAFAASGAVRRRWAKVAWAAYPFLTLFAIVVTGNHFFLDAVGGAVVFALGYLLGVTVSRHLDGWYRRRHADDAGEVELTA